MSCKTESKEINGHTYSVTQWPPERSILTKFKLTKMLGPAIAKIAGISKAIGGEDKDDVNTLAEGITELFVSTSPEEMLELLKTSVVGVARDGTKITESSFTEIFSGDDLTDVYKVFIFVLQVNYSNLLKGQLADRLLAQVEEKL